MPWPCAAGDRDKLLRNDPATQGQVASFEENFRLAAAGRHSHVSAGPRYRMFQGEDVPKGSPPPPRL